ncbi:hypothetical protein BGZ65_011585, partial [Modicella reniformis]
AHSPQEPLLPLTIAEDTKTLMDHPQFTKKISMTTHEIVARVLTLLNALPLLRRPPHESAPNKDLMRNWISLAGATTPLHYDRCHGILIQLVGRKRFVVFSHENTNNLYTYDGISGPGHVGK